MVFGKSVTFDDEDIGRAASSGKSAYAGRTEDLLFIDRLRAGDSMAFDALINRYSNDVYGLLYRLTENAEEAGDLTQDTFLRAFRSISGFRGDSELRTWLFRIAINESRNRFRWWKRRRRDKSISLEATIGETDLTIGDTLSDTSAGPEELALAREREYALAAALLDLSEIYREAVVLCDIEGLSYEEAAAALRINLGTVKSRLSRGREDLRRRLKGY
jgi:RNA polymerase sigma-70 factor (ECF subfamily)